MQIFCDFDGTISRDDTTDVILERFAAPEWQEIEQQWKAGEIGSAECMRRQIQLVKVELEKLNETLDDCAIDPYFPEFVSFCAESALPLTILSDGVHYFIQRILNNHNIHGLPVLANRLLFCGAGEYTLESPHRADDCSSQAGVCKCRAVEATGECRVFIGDGRSDFCASDKADIVFAKGALAVYCDQRDIAYTPYTSFSEIIPHLKTLLPTRPRTTRQTEKTLEAFA